jgi:hypothetical protein
MQKLARYVGDRLNVAFWFDSAKVATLFTESASFAVRITLVGESTWD